MNTQQQLYPTYRLFNILLILIFSSIHMMVCGQDNNPPVAICNDQLNVVLGADGNGWLYALEADEGSYDPESSNLTYEVRRTDGCLGKSDWDDYVFFSCCDKDSLVTIELKVSDAAGNSNICWSVALIEDIIAPNITCPKDVTIDCNDIRIYELSEFGSPEATDNCGEVSITYIEDDQRDQCGEGLITRKWEAMDASSKSMNTVCTQTIVVEHQSSFIVNFPSDVTISTCPDDLEIAGVPVITRDGCGMIATSKEDVIFEVVPDACYKIERTWTVVNWCTYDSSDPDLTPLGFPRPIPNTYLDDDGYFKYTQLIKVIDNIAPVLDCPADLTICDLSEDCESAVELSINAADACSSGIALNYDYIIDLNNDGVIEIAANNNNSNKHTGIYPYGTHQITWQVEDGCGNSSTCAYLFIIEDCKNPTPICKDGLTITNMETGCVEIWASDFLEKAFDNCTDEETLENSVKIRRAATDDALETNLTLCCDDLGVVDVEIWVEDEAGNQDFCTTYIILQDHDHNCDPSTSDQNLVVAGRIFTDSGLPVSDVLANLSGDTSADIYTMDDGTYAFNNLSLGATYTISPEKDVYPLNGISTYDLVLISQHILGVKEFNNPYQLIAADVNNDGTISTFDMLQLRQLILYGIVDFPTNTAWRFIAGNHTFEEPGNPWVSTFPESIRLSQLENSILDLNFIAIKVGDVSGDANGDFQNAAARVQETPLPLLLENIELQAGLKYDVTIKSESVSDFIGYQFCLKFNQNALKLIDITKYGAALNLDDFGLKHLEKGLIKTSWIGDYETNTPASNELFTLHFEVQKAGYLEDFLSLDNDWIDAEAYLNTSSGEIITRPFQLVYITSLSQSDSQLDSQSDIQLLGNYPNPFLEGIHIPFHLTQAGRVKLSIYAINGQLLYSESSMHEVGDCAFYVTSKSLNLSQNAILYCHIETQNATKKARIIFAK